MRYATMVTQWWLWDPFDTVDLVTVFGQRGDNLGWALKWSSTQK